MVVGDEINFLMFIILNYYVNGLQVVN